MVMVATLILIGSTLSVSADQYYRYSEREVREIGRGNGYDLGYIEGRRDERQHFRFDFKNNRAYKDGKIGYRSEYRHDGNYKQGFREGFEVGYRDGYYGRPRRDHGWRNRPWDDRRDDRDRRPYYPRY
jgi:hypothetical protein